MDYNDIHLSNTYMYVKCKITHSDGSDMKNTDYVGPKNLTLQSLFSQVEVSLQGKPITPYSGHYALKSMIQNLINYGSDAKSSYLTSQLWLKDVPGAVDDSNVKTGGNTSLFERYKYFAGGKLCDLTGPIMHDLFSVGRFLLNQVSVNVKFHRSKPSSYLMTSDLSPM